MVSKAEQLTSLPLEWEAQALIFEYLDIQSLVRCTSVSHAFKTLAEDTRICHKGLRAKLFDHREQHWNQAILAFLNSQPVISIEVLTQAAQKWPNATRLELAKSENNQIVLCPGFLQKLADLFPKLRSLTLINRSCSFNAFEGLQDDDLAAFSTKAQGLISISLNDCPNLTEAGYLRMLQAIKSLRHVSIDSDKISNLTVEAALMLAHISSLELSGFNAINGDCVPCFKSARNKLDTLSLMLAHGEDEAEPFTHAEVVEVLKYQTRLKSLCLKVCDALHPEIAHTIASKLEGIETINLHGSIEPNAALQLAQRCRALTHLTLSGLQATEPVEGALEGYKNKIRISLSAKVMI